MTTISAVIITKNEEANIRECLESVRWVDEIIVVDSGSTDETVAICREFTGHVHVYPWLGFGPQKNLALGHATKDWVLSIDADERVSDLLRDEIVAVIRETGNAGFAIPRLSSYCGKVMNHSGWRPDYVVRLFRREKGRFSDDIVHEKVLVDGKVGRLTADLIHYSFRSVEQVLDVVNHYSTLGAAKKYREGKRACLATAILHGLSAFVSAYLLKAGFLDGERGLMLAISNAEGAYYKYVKLMLLYEQKHDEGRKFGE
jgi:glycosyltransferase involved in cell wall biosynthesis